VSFLRNLLGLGSRKLYQQAILDLNQGRYPAAIKLFDQVIAAAGASAPRRHLARIYRGEAEGRLAEEAYRRGALAEAAAGLASAVAAGAVSGDRLLLWARAELAAGDPGQAADLTAAALVLKPEDPLALALLWLARRAQGLDVSELAARLAAQDDGWARDLEGETPTARIDHEIDRRLELQLALREFEAGETAAALARLRRLAAADPRDLRARTALAWILGHRGEIVEARRLLTEVAGSPGGLDALRRQLVELGCLRELGTLHPDLLEMGTPEGAPGQMVAGGGDL